MNLSGGYLLMGPSDQFRQAIPVNGPHVPRRSSRQGSPDQAGAGAGVRSHNQYLGVGESPQHRPDGSGTARGYDYYRRVAGSPADVHHGETSAQGLLGSLELAGRQGEGQGHDHLRRIIARWIGYVGTVSFSGGEHWCLQVLRLHPWWAADLIDC
jgi:hypothetical protein